MDVCIATTQQHSVPTVLSVQRTAGVFKENLLYQTGNHIEAQSLPEQTTLPVPDYKSGTGVRPIATERLLTARQPVANQ